VRYGSWAEQARQCQQSRGVGHGFCVALADALGSAPDARAYFLLCGQKKVAKEKATPGSVPAAPVPCATRRWRGLRNSGLRPSDSPRPLSASPCVARHLPRGPQGAAARLPCRIAACCGRRRKMGKNQNFVTLVRATQNSGLNPVYCFNVQCPH